MKFIYYYIIILVHLLEVYNLNAQDYLFVKPSITDSFINGNDDSHYVSVNRNLKLQNKLLLFFPGTGASTSEYTVFLNTASNLGFHTIGLSYENNLAPEYLCLKTSDTTCFDRARNEIIFGINQHISLNVDENNSIINRVKKLITYLNSIYPNDGWGQYIDKKDSLIWTNIIVAGHSQGGNHATFLSKLYQVERCIIFSSREWMAFYQEPAKWVQRPGKSLPSAYFGFVHALDTNTFGLNAEILENWSYLNMDNFGNLVNVDTLKVPFLESHMLTTYLTQPNSNNRDNYFHRTVIGNEDTPYDLDTIPIYKSVWEYMLGMEKKSLSINEDKKVDNELKIFPNPANSFISISNELINNKDFNVDIFNHNGKNVIKHNFQDYIDISNLKNGLYFLKIYNTNIIYTGKFIKQ